VPSAISRCVLEPCGSSGRPPYRSGGPRCHHHPHHLPDPAALPISQYRAGDLDPDPLDPSPSKKSNTPKRSRCRHHQPRRPARGGAAKWFSASNPGQTVLLFTQTSALAVAVSRDLRSARRHTRLLRLRWSAVARGHHRPDHSQCV